MDWDKTKQTIAEYAAPLCPHTGLVGLGSGTTSFEFVKALASLSAQGGYGLQCLAASLETELLAKTKGLPIINHIDWAGEIDVTFDGADAVDDEGTAIKGGGGALVREKILARASKRYVIMVDERKWHKPWMECVLPVAVIPFGLHATLRQIQQLGMKPTVRMRGISPFVTNDGLFIVDIPLSFSLPSLAKLDVLLKEIPGVVETGIFFHFASEIIIGYGNGKIEHTRVTV